MNPIRRFLESMTGRIFLILIVGIALAGSSALFLTDTWRRADLARARLERPVDRMQTFVDQISATPAEERADFAKRGTQGVMTAPATAVAGKPDPTLAQLFRTQLTEAAVTGVQHTEVASCQGLRFGGRGGPNGGPGGPQTGGQDGSPNAARRGDGGENQNGGRQDFARGGDGRGRSLPPQCWLVDLKLADGTAFKVVVDSPPAQVSQSRAFDPVFLLGLAFSAALMAFGLAAMTGAPLRRLAEAARTLGRNLDREPLPESGPREVREAAQAFNAMQLRLRQNLAERTQMLAAITHDLQTPLTRLRLRLEKVTDEPLRQQLVGDLAAMQVLIKEGLDMARSADRDEPVVVLDLDSLLESLIEDESSAGRDAVFVQRSGRDVAVQMQALRRCLLNLIDNAIFYGDKAEVSAAREGDKIVIRIRDQGPGIPPDKLEAVFEPLVRLEDSRSRETGGTGLGLSIARRLAEKNGGELTLRNHPYGGLEAVVSLPLP